MVTEQLPLPSVNGYLDDLEHEVRALVDQYGYVAVQSMVRQYGPPVPSAPARPTDPETSHAAGPRSGDLRRFSERSRAAKLLRAFSAHPMTDQVAASRVVGISASPSAFDACRRRCSDLRAAGLLEDSGQRHKNLGSNDESVVWQVTPEGELALANLDAKGWTR